MIKVEGFDFTDGRLTFYYIQHENPEIDDNYKIGHADIFQAQSGINIMIHSLENRLADLQKEIEQALNSGENVRL